MGLIDFYKRWTSNRTEKEKQNRRQEIQDEIKIALLKDSIWLVVGGVAVYKAKNKPAGNHLRQVCSLRYFFRLLAYLLLCLFFLSLFLRLCVDILCLFFFLPLGITVII